MAAYKVGYFVGSLATKSINRLLAKALVQVAPPELHMAEISFKDLPLYSYDFDANYPAVATEFKKAIAAVDAVLFVTREYNRSIPGALLCSGMRAPAFSAINTTRKSSYLISVLAF